MGQKIGRHTKSDNQSTIRNGGILQGVNGQVRCNTGGVVMQKMANEWQVEGGSATVVSLRSSRHNGRGGRR